MTNWTVDPSQGLTNETIQNTIDQAAAAGGGTVEIPAGTYRMHNALQLRSGVHVCGAAGTVLTKVPSVASPITNFVGYGLSEFTVQNPELFRVGMGVHLHDDRSGGFYNTVATIVAEHDGRFYIDRPCSHDYLPMNNALVTSLFPLVEGYNVSDASIEEVILDGFEETTYLNGCRGGGVFLIGSHRVSIGNVEVRHYRGDAISFQQCTDIVVEGCSLHDNTGSGLHPGSGSVRYIMRDNEVRNNGRYGVFYCLRTMYSRCENNRLEDNELDGISIGERDMHHLITGNTIVRNGGNAIDFRQPIQQSGDFVRIEKNQLGPNSLRERNAEITIPSGLTDIEICGNQFEGGTTVDIGKGCQRISVHHNAVNGEPQNAEPYSAPLTLPVGPEAFSANAAQHLRVA